MPSVHIPKLCRHKATGQAFVQLPGSKKQVYLGPYGSPAAEAEYRRIVAELGSDPAAEVRDVQTHLVYAHLAVHELALAYLRHCDATFRFSEDDG